MRKIHLFGIGLVTLASAVAFAGVLSSNNSLGNLTVKAEETIETVEFVRDGTANLKHSGDKWTTKAVSNSGTAMYACSNTTFDITNRTYVCSFQKTVEGEYLTFAADEDGNTALRFQYIKSISVVTASFNLRKFVVETSNDGTSWTNKGIAEFTNSELSTDLVEGAHYVRISRATTDTTSFVSIKVSYVCNPNGEETTNPDTPDTPETPSIAGNYVSGSYTLSLSDNGTASYNYGDYTMSLTYVATESTISFTLLSGDNEYFGAKRLFNGSETVNSTGVFTSTGIKISTYGAFGASTTPFTKQ